MTDMPVLEEDINNLLNTGEVPNLFSKKEDIEIAGFLTATIAWGNRTMIIKNSQRLVELLDLDPYQFIMNLKFSVCVRTFDLL